MIISEIGVNFTDMDTAKEMIQLSKENGAALVKGQLFSVEGLDRTPETLAKLKQSQLTYEQAKELFDYGASIGIEVFYSAFDVERVEWCESIGVKRYKIAARANDRALLDAIKETKKPVIASVSPNYPRDPRWADGFYNIDFLYCPSKYPAPLDSMRFNQVDFNFAYQGFSDHTIGILAAGIALARGARIIEKHFCISRDCIDGKWSMDARELKELSEWEKLVQSAL